MTTCQCNNHTVHHGHSICQNNIRNYWGQRLWRLLHKLTYDLMCNQVNVDVYSKFFECVVPCLLPCGNCKNHYLRYVHYFPIKNVCIVDWLLRIHNIINFNEKKPLWTRVQADSYYNTYKAHADFIEMRRYYFGLLKEDKITRECYDTFVRVFLLVIPPPPPTPCGSVCNPCVNPCEQT